MIKFINKFFTKEQTSDDEQIFDLLLKYRDDKIANLQDLFNKLQVQNLDLLSKLKKEKELIKLGLNCGICSEKFENLEFTIYKKLTEPKIIYEDKKSNIANALYGRYFKIKDNYYKFGQVSQMFNRAGYVCMIEDYIEFNRDSSIFDSAQTIRTDGFFLTTISEETASKLVSDPVLMVEEFRKQLSKAINILAKEHADSSEAFSVNYYNSSDPIDNRMELLKKLLGKK